MTNEHFTPPAPPPGWTVVTEHAPREQSYGAIFAAGLNEWLGAAVRLVDLEGACFIGAAVLGAIGASYIHPAGPWLVVAGVLFVMALLLSRRAATPRREPTFYSAEEIR